MKDAFLGIALAAHELWLRDDERGTWLVTPKGADLRSANLRSANLRSADLSFTNLRSANLSFADLSSADLSYANLSFADLSSANLRYADLSSADLSSADLSYADLSSADLRYADLRSADLRYANRIIGPQRSDRYLFTYCLATERVCAGCQCMTIGEYRLHTQNYNDKEKQRETLAILDCLELLVAARKESDKGE